MPANTGDDWPIGQGPLEPADDPLDATLFGKSLRQLLRKQIPLREAVRTPVQRFLNSTFRDRRTMHGDATGGFVMEVMSTWLLLEALVDEDFSPIAEGADDIPLMSHPVIEMLQTNTEMGRWTKAMCWLQMEMRKRFYLERMNEQASIFVSVDGGGILAPGGHLSEALYPDHTDREAMYHHCVQCVLAEEVMTACGVSHLAAPLYSRALPPLNLFEDHGVDIYRRCLSIDILDVDFPDPPADHSVVNISRVMRFSRDALGMTREAWTMMTGRNDAQFGTSMQTATMDWACRFKAEAAAQKGNPYTNQLGLAFA